MNVNDITLENSFKPGQDTWGLILERQHELAMKYTPIEKANGLLETEDFPVVLDDRKGQARLKNFAWRIQEELYEATEALVLHKEDQTHFLEEMIDAVHFYAELVLLCGYQNELKDQMAAQILACEALTNDHLHSNEVAGYIYCCIGQPLGQAMNCLKNKPWKQSHMTTDEEKFKFNILAISAGFVRVLHNLFNMTEEDIFNLYFKKSEVNKFRIRSNY